jgi:diguanylate cyclase (GGDEF)-like protein/PAS domain S-box-containing protein
MKGKRIKPSAGNAGPSSLYWKSLVESISNGIVSLDSENKVIGWNRGAERMFGYSKKEVLGKNIDLLIGGKNMAEAMQVTKASLIKHKNINLPDTARYRKDGHPVNLSVSASPIISGGKTLGAVAIYKDIAEWKKREELICHIQRLLRAIGDINQLIIQESNPDHLFQKTCEILSQKVDYRFAQVIALAKNGRPIKYYGGKVRYWKKALSRCLTRIRKKRGALFIPNIAKSSWCRPTQIKAQGWSAFCLIRNEKDIYGLLHVGNASECPDRDQELNLLQEIAADLGFALSNIRKENERQIMEQELKRLKEFNENIVRSLAEGILIENTEGAITFVNPTLEKLLGYAPGELIGCHYTKILPEDEVERIAIKTKSRKSNKLEKYEARLLTKKGREIPVLVSAQSLFANKELKGVLTAIADVSPLKQLEKRLIESNLKLKDIASRDTLTGLWNRATILYFLEEELERGSRDHYPISIIITDIDLFKNVNDSYGHLIGDTVLINVCSAIRKNIRPYDRLGRFGGDELLIVLPNCGQEDALKIAERLRLSVSRAKANTMVGAIRTTISAGVTSSESFPHPSANALIQWSDKALYEAKKRGRNSLVISSVSCLSAGNPEKNLFL